MNILDRVYSQKVCKIAYNKFYNNLTHFEQLLLNYSISTMCNAIAYARFVSIFSEDIEDKIYCITSSTPTFEYIILEMLGYEPLNPDEGIYDWVYDMIYDIENINENEIKYIIGKLVLIRKDLEVD